MGNRIKITVIATVFNLRTAGDGRNSNVIPLSATDGGARNIEHHAASDKSIDYRLASLKNDLDEPAFLRRRVEK